MTEGGATENRQAGRNFVVAKSANDIQRPLGSALADSPRWFRLTGQPALLNDQKLIELRQQYWVCSAEKARRELDFEAQYDLATGVRLTAQWYRENGWL